MDNRIRTAPPVRRLLATAVVVAIMAAAPLAAEQPNIEPGEWETTSVMTFQSDFPIPDQTETTTDCLTLEDIESGDAFMELEDIDECELTERELHRDGMSFTMICRDPQGVEFDMNAQLEFMGDHSLGKFIGNMETPMGPMQMNVDTQGRRIGDC